MRGPAHEVRGTRQFAAKLASVDKGSDLWKAVDNCLEELKANAQAGIKIPRSLWPRGYVKDYGLTNLYKCNLAGAWRLLYTIYVESGRVKVLAIDYMSHKEYEELFRY